MAKPTRSAHLRFTAQGLSRRLTPPNVLRFAKPRPGARIWRSLSAALAYALPRRDYPDASPRPTRCGLQNRAPERGYGEAYPQRSPTPDRAGIIPTPHPARRAAVCNTAVVRL